MHVAWLQFGLWSARKAMWIFTMSMLDSRPCSWVRMGLPWPVAAEEDGFWARKWWWDPTQDRIDRWFYSLLFDWLKVKNAKHICRLLVVRYMTYIYISSHVWSTKSIKLGNATWKICHLKGTYSMHAKVILEFLTTGKETPAIPEKSFRYVMKMLIIWWVLMSCWTLSGF